MTVTHTVLNNKNHKQQTTNNTRETKVEPLMVGALGSSGMTNGGGHENGTKSYWIIAGISDQPHEIKAKKISIT